MPTDNRKGRLWKSLKIPIKNSNLTNIEIRRKRFRITIEVDEPTARAIAAEVAKWPAKADPDGG